MDLWLCAVCWTLVVSVWLNLTSLTLTLRWGMRVLYSPFKKNCYGTSRCLAEFDFTDPHPQMSFAGITFTSLFLSYYSMFGQIWHSWHVLSGEGCRCCIHPLFFYSTSQHLAEFDFADPYSQVRTVGVHFTFCHVTSQCLDEFSLPDCQWKSVCACERERHTLIHRERVCERERQRVREKDT